MYRFIIGYSTLVFTSFVKTSRSVSNEMIMTLNLFQEFWVRRCFVPRVVILNTVHMSRGVCFIKTFMILKIEAK